MLVADRHSWAPKECSIRYVLGMPQRTALPVRYGSADPLSKTDFLKRTLRSEPALRRLSKRAAEPRARLRGPSLPWPAARSARRRLRDRVIRSVADHRTAEQSSTTSGSRPASPATPSPVRSATPASWRRHAGPSARPGLRRTNIHTGPPGGGRSDIPIGNRSELRLKWRLHEFDRRAIGAHGIDHPCPRPRSSRDRLWRALSPPAMGGDPR